MLVYKKIMLKFGIAILIVILKIHCVPSRSVTETERDGNEEDMLPDITNIMQASSHIQQPNVPNFSATKSEDSNDSFSVPKANSIVISIGNGSSISADFDNTGVSNFDNRLIELNHLSTPANDSNFNLVTTELLNKTHDLLASSNGTQESERLKTLLNATDSSTSDEKDEIKNFGNDLQNLKKNMDNFRDNFRKLLYEGEAVSPIEKLDDNTEKPSNFSSDVKNQRPPLQDSVSDSHAILNDNIENVNYSRTALNPINESNHSTERMSVEDKTARTRRPSHFKRISAIASNISEVTKKMGAFLQNQYLDSNQDRQPKNDREVLLSRGLENLVSGVADDEDSSGPQVLQQWVNLEESFRESVDAVVRQALPLLVRASSEMQLSNGCYTSFFQLLLGLRRLRPWAFQMIDAFGKPPAGMLQGTVTSFGAYDECVNIVAMSDAKKKKKKNVGQQQYFRGKYCTVEIKPPLPPKPQYYTMYQPVSILANFSSGDDNVVRQAARQAHAFYFLTYRMDICVPSTCTQDDVNNMAQFAAKYIDIEVAVPRCSVLESLDLDKSQVVIICIVGVLLTLVICGTFLDTLQEIFYRTKTVAKCLSNVLAKFMLSFSLNTNADLLLNTEAVQNGLDSLHGMRFFGMGWLILGHTYFNSNAQMYGNLSEASGFAEGFLFQVIVNSTVSIDTFFFISGVLLAYLTLQSTSKHGYYSIPRLFIRRLIRVLPPYMMVIGATFILPHLGSGPFWNETVDPVVESCRKNWWTNILFLNNFVTTPGERCLEHSWYLSCDFQLFVIALFILLALIKRPVLGMALNLMMIMISMVMTGMLTYYYKVPPTLLASFPDPEERKFLNHVIISKPYCHLGPYCVGLATGYFFYTCKKIQLKPYHHLLGWGSSITVTAAVVYGVLEWNKGNMPSTAASLAYAAAHRTAWALGLSWITVICVSGYGGIINRILSWKVFIPLSRLTYMVYLIHPLIQYILTGYIRERLQTNHIILAYLFFGHIMTSYSLSAACFFLFDGPVEALMRLLLGDCTAPAPLLSKCVKKPIENNSKTDKQRKL